MLSQTNFIIIILKKLYSIPINIHLNFVMKLLLRFSLVFHLYLLITSQIILFDYMKNSEFSLNLNLFFWLFNISFLYVPYFVKIRFLQFHCADLVNLSLLLNTN